MSAGLRPLVILPARTILDRLGSAEPIATGTPTALEASS